MVRSIIYLEGYTSEVTRMYEWVMKKGLEKKIHTVYSCLAKLSGTCPDCTNERLSWKKCGGVVGIYINLCQSCL